jgi:calcineurin-like phosphoesterase family protein
MESPNPYFIEIRIVGRLKYDILSTMGVLSKRFHLDTSKIVPHIRLVGPFKTENEEKLIEDFENVCRQTPLLKYKINDLEVFDSTGVLYLDIEENDDIELFRLAMTDELRDYCRLSHWDFIYPFKLHLTLATNVRSDVANVICSYIHSCKPFVYEYPLLRVTLLKAGKILCEYDFMEEYLYDYRKPDDVERSRDSITQYFRMVNEVKQLNPQIYFTSDLHLCDINVSYSCKRPFRDIEDMNTTLVCNWNAVITPADTVYYLGDFMYYGCNQEDFEAWVSHLNGNIIFVRGNHDEHINSDKISFADHVELDIGDRKLYMIHNPHNIPEEIKNDENYWVVHGHTHNKLLNTHPFCNRVTRHINVSTDVTHYRPVSLEEIKNLIYVEENTQKEVILDSEQTNCWLEAN